MKPGESVKRLVADHLCSTRGRPSRRLSEPNAVWRIINVDGAPMAKIDLDRYDPDIAFLCEIQTGLRDEKGGCTTDVSGLKPVD